MPSPPTWPDTSRAASALWTGSSRGTTATDKASRGTTARTTATDTRLLVGGLLLTLKAISWDEVQSRGWNAPPLIPPPLRKDPARGDEGVLLSLYRLYTAGLAGGTTRPTTVRTTHRLTHRNTRAGCFSILNSCTKNRIIQELTYTLSAGVWACTMYNHHIIHLIRQQSICSPHAEHNSPSPACSAVGVGLRLRWVYHIS